MVQRTWLGKYLWLGLVLATTLSCGGIPPCYTTGGMVVLGDSKGETPEHWRDCVSIQFAEDTMIRELPQYNPKNLAGYSIYLTDPLPLPDGTKIVGQTICSRKIIRVLREHLVLESALAHEIGHALQNCQPKLPLDPEWTDEWWAEDHADWYREGVFKAIDKATTP